MSSFSRRALVAGLATLPMACGQKNEGTQNRAADHARRAEPTLTKTAKTKHHLVELIRLAPDIKLDIRYASAQNVTGRVLYTQARAFLVPDAAAALLKVRNAAQKLGFGLMIFDAYRPWRITKALWDATPPAQRSFVANPKTGSRHNRGSAVDLTLYDLKTGQALSMPSDFDDFSVRAHRDFSGGTENERSNRDTLIQLMERYGFVGRTDEWWHYDWKQWKLYSIMDVPFEDL